MSTNALLVAKWEEQLKNEGLAPIDRVFRGRMIVKRQIVGPRKQCIDDPFALLRALDAWRSGDRTVFDSLGKRLLLRRKSRRKRAGQRTRRLRYLLHVLNGMTIGLSLHAAAKPYDSAMAYILLPKLYASLQKSSAVIDDEFDTSGDDGIDQD